MADDAEMEGIFIEVPENRIEVRSYSAGGRNRPRFYRLESLEHSYHLSLISHKAISAHFNARLVRVSSVEHKKEGSVASRRTGHGHFNNGPQENHLRNIFPQSVYQAARDLTRGASRERQREPTRLQLPRADLSDTSGESEGSLRRGSNRTMAMTHSNSSGSLGGRPTFFSGSDRR